MAAAETKNIYTVRLLGTPEVLVNNRPVAFPYKKVEGLFYYLCVEKRIMRSAAISILWTDCDETSARKNLRDALYHIKRIIAPDFVLSEGNSVLYL
ncbi:MAG: ATP-binding protein, partial [Lachnospiraceae bacterium]|nr:ATP-binding protein [Lachnospiraceae bacterium]